jgi:hypothetical protein
MYPTTRKKWKTRAVRCCTAMRPDQLFAIESIYKHHMVSDVEKAGRVGV